MPLSAMLETKMRSLTSIARLSSEGLSCATIFFAPVFGSTRTNWPSAVSTTKRLPLESKLTAAGDLGDLALEPQRAVQHVVGSEFEAVEAAHLLHDLARRLDALDVDLIERVTEENLRRVEPSVLAEGERVDAGQAGGEFLHRAVALARIEIAGEEGCPRHGAVGRKRNVVGHAFR